MRNEPFDPLAGLEPTRLRDCASLARRHGIGRLLVKMENERPLGNFKYLGGVNAGLRALRRAPRTKGAPARPRLLCASDGNHGLAVAAAARRAGAAATIFLHQEVAPARAQAIEAMGAKIVTVAGTYDDAVEAAAAAAARGEGLLVPDTSADADDPVVGDVMAGYGIMCREITRQARDLHVAGLTHIFAQCGVGGLAAALAEGLHPFMQSPGRLVAVEPETAACVGHALATGRVERIPGTLRTSAEMLSCGLASVPAVEILRRYGASALTVGEAMLDEAVKGLRPARIETTASGAAGYAGLRRAAADPVLRERLQLGAQSVVLLVVTEGRAPSQPGRL